MITALGGVALLLAVLSGLGLVGILLSLFVVVAGLGFVLPNATALALAGRPSIAGSASALIGVMQFAIGAMAAPLVGAWGTNTALPMGIVIAALDIAALLVFVLLVRSGRGSESAIGAVNAKS